MRPVFVLVVCCACGAAPVVQKPVPLAITHLHARTLAERRARACGREHLVTLEHPTLADATAVDEEDRVVQSRTVRDGGNDPIDVEAATLGPLRIGDLFAIENAREVGRRLWKTGRFDDVAIETEPVQGGVAVVFRVTRKRVIAEVFTDNTDVDDLHVAQGAVYDPVALVSAGHALVASYVKRGHLDASLALTSDFSDDGHRTIDLCVRFDAGVRITLDGMDVRGTAHGAALSALLAREDDRNVRGNVLDMEMLERDQLVMMAWLYDQGLLAAKIAKTVERHDGGLIVAFQVTDGAVYRYASVDVRGDLAAPKPTYTKLVTAKRGDVFNRTAMMKVIEDMNTLDKSLGREDLQIEPQTEMDAAKSTVSIVFAVHRILH